MTNSTDASPSVTVGQTVYVTRWALARGVEEAVVESVGRRWVTGDLYVRYRLALRSVVATANIGDCVFTTREAAVAAAEKMRVKAIAAAKKRIAKLEAMRFE